MHAFHQYEEVKDVHHLWKHEVPSWEGTTSPSRFRLTLYLDPKCSVERWNKEYSGNHAVRPQSPAQHLPTPRIQPLGPAQTPQNGYLPPSTSFCLSLSSISSSPLTNPASTCLLCSASRYSSSTSPYLSLPLYLATSSPQLLTALANRPGTPGSFATSVMGWKYVRIVNATPPLRGKRRKLCRSVRR